MLDASTDHIKPKIANAEQMKVHTMLVIGARDMDAHAVSVRIHGQGNLRAKPRGDVIADILQWLERLCDPQRDGILKSCVNCFSASDSK